MVFKHHLYEYQRSTMWRIHHFYWINVTLAVGKSHKHGEIRQTLVTGGKWGSWSRLGHPFLWLVRKVLLWQ